jgi:hypothetical protein
VLQFIVRNSNFLVLCYREYYSMDGYPCDELADMHLTHGHANGNGQRAAHLYQEIFPHYGKTSASLLLT